MASTAATAAAEKAKVEMEQARGQVMECEKEIQSIKTALRQLGEDSTHNSLEVAALKVSGLPENSQPTFVLQLSSPVEEAVLSKLWSEDADGDDKEGATVVFNQVETSVATLSVTAKDEDIPLGVSASHDVAPLCRLDAMKPQTEYVTELDVAIVAPGVNRQDSFKDAMDHEEGTSQTETKDTEKEKEETTEEATADETKTELETPVCTVTFRITYKPSVKDRQEELYDLLNKASQRKAQAIDRLRKSATAVSRAGPTGGAMTESSARSGGSPAVKPGFLNKKETKPNKLKRLYQTTIGPDSFLRRIFPSAKDYLIFFGATVFFHFKGHLLALPPPV